MLAAKRQMFGESANELVAKWGNRGYRYGFPDYIAAEFPVRPMNYDQSRMYSGVFGKKYLDSKTARYYFMYDPNLYLQPGSGGLGSVSEGTSRLVVIGGAIAVAAILAVGAMAIGRAGRDRDDWDSIAAEDY